MATDNYTSNINVNVNTGQSLAELRRLQAGLSSFHQEVARGNKVAAKTQDALNARMIGQIGSIRGLSAEQRTIAGTTEQFTTALERNKLSLREYARYSAAGFLEGDLGRVLSKRSGLIRNAFAQEREILTRAYKDRVQLLQSQWVRLTKPGMPGGDAGIRITPTDLAGYDKATRLTKDFATNTQLAAQRMQILNATIKQGSTQLINWGKNTQWAGRQLMVGLTVPLVMIGAVAAKTFKELETETVRFRRVYGDLFTDDQQTDQAVDNIMRLGKEFMKLGITLKSTMKIAADAAAMGKVGYELEEQVRQATKLAVLGGVEQEQALATTISLTNAFGLAAEDLAQKINFLNAVENQTVVSIEDLTVAIPKAGPVVEQLGGSVEDLAFFLTAMREGGINASESANALKSGLASLINPTDKAAEVFAKVGINVRGIVEANKGDLKGTVLGFAEAINELDRLGRAQGIEQLFGKFQFARLSTLFKNITKDGSQANRVLQLSGSSVEELAILSERELNKVEESVGVKFQKALEEVKATLLPIGKMVLESMVPVLQAVGKIVEKFNNLGDGTKKFILIFATAFPAVLMGMGLFGNLVGNTIKVLWGFNMIMAKVRGQSNVLGASFNYMTKEELTNISMTQSLNLEHSKLIQVFNVEAGVVNNLTAAYARNAAAARTMAATSPGLFIGGKAGAKGAVGKLPKKFNRGTDNVRYYSKGTDTVPAMLTPGEAVIPAGAAQDPANKPIIQAMISGERGQGFETGDGEVKKKPKRQSSKSSSGLTPAQKAQNRSALSYYTKNPNSVAGGIKAAETKKLNALKAETQAITQSADDKKKTIKEERRAKVGKVAGRLGGAAMLGGMVAYGTGNAGLGNALMAGGMLAQFAPLLMNPYVAAGAAVVAMTAGIYVLNKVMEGRARKEEQFVRSITANTDQMKKISEITNTVGAAQKMSQRRSTGFFQQYNEARERQGRSFGSQFISSDIGKEVYGAFTKNKDLYGTKQAAKQFAVQLGSYVSDGIMTAEQANSIAEQIAINLGDISIKTNIEAELRNLIGPNGEDLLKNPLQVRIRLIAANEKQANKLAGDEGFQSLADRAKAEDTWYQTESTLRLRAGAAQMAGYAGQATEFAQAQLDALTVYYEDQQKSLRIALEQTKDLEKRAELEKQIAESKRTQTTQEQVLQKEVSKTLDRSMQQFKTLQETKDAFGFGFSTAQEKKEDAYFDALKGKIKDIYRGTDFETGANTLLNTLARMDSENSVLDNKTGQWVAQYKASGFDTKTEAQDFEVEMQLLLANRIANPAQIDQFMQIFSGNLKEGKATLRLAIDKFGAGKAFEMQSMIGNLSGVGAGKLIKKGKRKGERKDLTAEQLAELQQEITIEITNMNPEDYERVGKALATMSELDGNEINMTFMLNKLREQGKLDDFANTLEKIENIDLSKDKKQIEIDLIESGMPAGGVATVMANWEYYQKLPPEIRKEALQKFATIYNFKTNFEDEAARRQWAADMAEKEALKAGPKGSQSYQIVYDLTYNVRSNLSADQASQKATEDYIGDIVSVVPSTPAPGSGDNSGKKQVSVLDDLLKRLRDVRKNQVKVTEGWNASMKAIDNLFGGKKRLDMFSGIEQDLSRLGAKGNFIDLIVGMDPKEYEAKKRSLFRFDNKDNIIGLKRDAKSIQETLNSIVGGEFAAQLVRQKTELQDQETAFQKLTAAGIGAADAYSILSNKALASVIANDKEAKSVEKLIKLYEKRAKQQKLASLKEDARTDTEEYARMQTARKNLAEEAKKQNWSWLEVDAIVNNEALMGMAELGEFGSEAFANRLQQILGSIEFKESIFNKGFDKAMEKFSVMETEIEIKFQQNTLLDQDIIEKAQDKIAELQYQIDDFEAQLVDIEDQEKVINEQYDKAGEALDHIAEINEKINKQKKAQITIADALTQGDIAAAARAAQDMKEQQTSDNISTQRKALDIARQNKLDALQSKNGLTRKQIDEEIEKLNKSIFKIEEESLEPAAERVRKAEAEKRELTQSLTVLGRTKLEWEAVKNRIDLAKTSSAEYMQAIAAALGVVEDIIEYWNDLNGKIITTTHNIVVKYLYEGSTPMPTTVAPVITTVATTPKAPDTYCTPQKPYYNYYTGECVATQAEVKPGTSAGTGANAPVVTKAPVVTNAPVVTTKAASTGTIQPNTVAGYSTPIVVQPNTVAGYSTPIVTIAPAVTTKAASTGSNTVVGYTPVIVTTKAPVVTNAPVVTTKAASTGSNTVVGYTPVIVTTKAPTTSGGGGGGGGGAYMMFMAKGGAVMPKYFAKGSLARGTDKIPAMLSPGEFVVSKYAVQNYGVDRLRAINNGDHNGDSSVYNYSLNVNVNSDADPNEIARSVIMQIKQLDSQRIRGNRY